MLGPTMHRTRMAHWVLASHPDRFRVLDSVLERDEEWWRTGGRPLAKGDRVAIWKYKGREAHRGVVGFGEVLTDPVEMEQRDEDDPYWIAGRPDALPARAPRVRVRYSRPPRLPLWLGETRGSVLGELSVARAQGGTAFRIDDEQWLRLVDEAGGWPAVSADVAADVTAIEDTVRNRGHGQGKANDALRRRAVELRAVALVDEMYRAAGWRVTDVSATSPYDLYCEQGDIRRRVEVKGSSGGPETVLLTSNEVIAARADPASAALAVVHGITVVDTPHGLEGRGGEMLLIDPWDVDRGTLTVLAYRYLVPMGPRDSAGGHPALASSTDSGRPPGAHGGANPP